MNGLFSSRIRPKVLNVSISLNKTAKNRVISFTFVYFKMDFPQWKDTELAPCLSQDSDGIPVETESMLEKNNFPNMF